MKEELSAAAALDISAGLLQTADGPELLCPSHALSEAAGSTAWLDSISFMVGFKTVERPVTCLERNMFPLCPLHNQQIQPRHSRGYLRDLCGWRVFPTEELLGGMFPQVRNRVKSLLQNPSGKPFSCHAGRSTGIALCCVSPLQHDWLNSILQLMNILSTFLSYTLNPFNLFG